jgi:hypothetical protein
VEPWRLLPQPMMVSANAVQARRASRTPDRHVGILPAYQNSDVIVFPFPRSRDLPMQIWKANGDVNAQGAPLLRVV